MKTILVVVSAWGVALGITSGGIAADTPAASGNGAGPSFNRDVKPILSTYCFACHGPDEEAREAKLRFDTREGALADLDGFQAVVPGKPDESELFLRITSDDKKEQMPPRKTGKKLSPDQIETLRKWIAAGGKYDKHWAFVAPERAALPAVKNETWKRNAIDRFVLARLESNELAPSRAADRYTLIRRVYFDLIGLPPTLQQADAFVADQSPNAYEKVVDELLASKHYGERWARQWLDLARYADTNGYEKDRPRSIWPYRDWVINAINADMPFDQFTIEQLAGDMLPSATASQRIATGFHRNTMLNEEGGIDPLEYRFYAMVDRVATTGSVWLGLTTGCAQCHTHKYDPITHTDYYRLMALLNNADEPDFAVPNAVIQQRRDALLKQTEALEARLLSDWKPQATESKESRERRTKITMAFDTWVKAEQAKATSWRIITPSKSESNLPKLEVLNDGSILSTGDVTKRDVYTLTFDLVEPTVALRLEVLPDERLPAGGPGRAYYEGRQGDFFLSEVSATWGNEPIKFANASHTYGKISIGSGNANATNVFDGNGSTGWATAGREGESNQLVLNLAKRIDHDGRRPGGKQLKIEMLFERHFVASLGRFRWSVSSGVKPQVNSLPVAIEAILVKPRDRWNDVERATIRKQFALSSPLFVSTTKKLDALRKQVPRYQTTLVMLERPADNPRPTHRHHRGEYLTPKERVAPALMSLFENQSKTKPTNRLALARWLVSKGNPLAARVAVNRAWQAFFGTGIVETSGDFGTQGSPPSHPKLLDWLAVQFMEQGWSRKKLHRLIVTSATYRQDSKVTPAMLKADPENRLLARGPRFRLPAEMIRDAALTASGVLSRKLGGPSVFPPQPASVTSYAWGGYRWRTSTGDDRYRRSLYTFAKRTTPFAGFTVFNGPTGESCIVRRNRSNTPLQALSLLNDEMYLELARSLASRAMKAAASPGDRAAFIVRQLLTRPANEQELTLLLAYHASQVKRLNAGELKATEVVGQETAKPDGAAWVMVARVVMNTDEAITKQ